MRINFDKSKTDDGTKPVLKKRRLVAESSLFSVFFDELSSGGEQRAADYLVVAPKRVAANSVTGVAVLPIYKSKIGLIKTYRHPIQETVWEVPRGFIDEGEEPIASARRELEEETGLSGAPDSIHSLGFVTPEAGVLRARIHVFVALKCRKVRSYTPSELGHQEFHLFTPAEVEKMITSSEIQDSTTIAACSKYLASPLNNDRTGGKS
jgi:ADP-ribose pyrophosphatase